MLLYSRKDTPATTTKPATTKFGVGDPPGTVGFAFQLTSFVTELVGIVTGSENETDALRLNPRPENRCDASGKLYLNTFIDLTNCLVKFAVCLA